MYGISSRKVFPLVSQFLFAIVCRQRCPLRWVQVRAQDSATNYFFSLILRPLAATNPPQQPENATARTDYNFWHRFFFPAENQHFFLLPIRFLMRLFSLKPLLLLSLAATLGGTAACTDENGNPILFSIEDDKALGEQVAAQTDSTYRAKGQLLERSNSANKRAYELLDGVVNKVLNSGELQYRNDFPWDVKIIKDDATQNAFATPGGHIYVYSGLIKFLEDESQLAGVLGHEIAHADRRHTSRQLQQQYGIETLLGLVLGENPGQLVQIAAGLGQLSFSRDFEREADQYSVIYLNKTTYACDGAAGFFIKSEAQGGANTPEFLSTHPNPGSRVQDIQAKAAELKCQGRSVSNSNFEELKRII